MKDKRALQKIRDEFQKFTLDKPQGFTRRWTPLPREKNDLLAHALRYLCESMQVDRAAVFLYDEPRQTLVARQLVDRADVLPGEEEIVLLPNSPLRSSVVRQTRFSDLEQSQLHRLYLHAAGVRPYFWRSASGKRAPPAPVHR